MTEIYLYPNESIRENAVFLVGSVSHGNIAQMAADCILATTFISRSSKIIGGIYSEDVYPISGYESYSDKEEDSFLCNPIEIHEINLKSPVYIILLRSLAFAGHIESLAENILTCIAPYKPKGIIALTGASTEDVELADSRNFYYSSTQESFWWELFPNLNFYLDALAQLNLPSSTKPVSRPAIINYSHDEESLAPYGMMLAKRMIQSLESGSTANYPLLIIGKFVEEGDNLEDGLELASNLCFALGITSSPLPYDALAKPLSWRIRLYGQNKASYEKDYSMVY